MAPALRVLCIRSWAPFSWGRAGRMRWCWMPRCIHQTLSRESPWMPVVAKGTPLSVRIARRESVGAEGGGRRPGGRPVPLMERQALAGEQEAGVLIGDRQRVAVDPIAGPEVPLEVGGPEVIGSAGVRRDDAGMERGPPPPAPLHQTAARGDRPRYSVRATRAPGAAGAASRAVCGAPSWDGRGGQPPAAGPRPWASGAGSCAGPGSDRRGPDVRRRRSG